MNAFAQLKARLATRTDGEHEQALVRLMLVGLVLAYFTLFVGPRDGWSDLDFKIVIALVGFFAVAIGIFAGICIWPAANTWRRLIGMISDASAVTFFVWLAGAGGVSGIGLYLFIIFGNGFRYGHRDLLVCQGLCLAGFIAALGAAPYWEQHRVEGIGLLMTLYVLPFYVSILMQRIQQAHVRAEQALKEYLERERRTA